MAILSGPEIISAVHREEIHITPFEPGLVNPASIDLRLGHEITFYSDWVFEEPGAPHWLSPTDRVLDVKKKPETSSFLITDMGYVLRPKILYLMHTIERVCTTKFIPVLDGKSSIGRLGIQVHITAGFGDPGYDGQYTLEVSVMHPIRIYPDMRICQMRFHEMVGSFMDYQDTGHYKGEGAKGAVASAAHTQFRQ
jgi:dCTP deaminase